MADQRSNTQPPEGSVQSTSNAPSVLVAAPTANIGRQFQRTSTISSPSLNPTWAHPLVQAQPIQPNHEEASTSHYVPCPPETPCQQGGCQYRGKLHVLKQVTPYPSLCSKGKGSHLHSPLRGPFMFPSGRVPLVGNPMEQFSGPPYLHHAPSHQFIPVLPPRQGPIQPPLFQEQVGLISYPNATSAHIRPGERNPSLQMSPIPCVPKDSMLSIQHDMEPKPISTAVPLSSCFEARSEVTNIEDYKGHATEKIWGPTPRTSSSTAGRSDPASVDPPPSPPYRGDTFIPWRTPPPDLEVSQPITEEQRPIREMMKRQAQREREEAACWTKLGRIKFFEEWEKDMEISKKYGYPH